MTAQIFINLFCLSSIWAGYSPELNIRRWGPVFGLASQPFWFYATYQAHQWGLFFLSGVYTGLYIWRLVTCWRQYDARD